ncbi:hypothetical protein ACWGE1_31470 [Streptomyces sp. NPDC054932]
MLHPIGVAEPSVWPPPSHTGNRSDSHTPSRESREIRTDATNLEISFRDGRTETECQYAERSVAAFVEHSLTEAARVRAAEAGLEELTDALDAPLRKLVELEKGATS